MAKIVAAYILWLFFGFAGVHRFYLRRPLSGTLFLLGFLALGCLSLFPGVIPSDAFLFLAASFGCMWMIDACLIPQMIESEQYINIRVLDVYAEGTYLSDDFDSRVQAMDENTFVASDHLIDREYWNVDIEKAVDKDEAGDDVVL